VPPDRIHGVGLTLRGTTTPVAAGAAEVVQNGGAHIREVSARRQTSELGSDIVLVMTTNFRRSLAATGAATLLTALGAFATMEPASAAPGSGGVLSGNVVNSQAATPGHVTVTALSKTDFDDQSGEAQCTSVDGLTYCQILQSHGRGSAAYDDWTVYIGVPQGSLDASMSIGNGFEYTADVHASSSYVKVVWNSPNIPSLTTLGTNVRITLDSGSTYSANGVATYNSEDLEYDQDIAIDLV
jgi:hypothetical protein